MTLKTSLNKAIFPYIKYKRKGKRFIFNGNEYDYFIHEKSWNTERVVEIPIVLDYIYKECCQTREPYLRILEFGNTLTQFYNHNYDILDKYSIGKGVIHKDIIDFKPKNKYDLIFSISTLEHVGYNEEVEFTGHNEDTCNINKTKLALKNIKENCLSKNGKMIFTICLGYNLLMDEEIFKDNLGFDKLLFMKRTSENNEWKEIRLEDFSPYEIVYGHPYNNANYICVGYYDYNK